MKVNTHHARVEKSHPHRAGFTLVEMLVVIAIIGILTAVLVPVIGGALRSAREATVKMDMKQIETAIENYKAKVSAYPVDFGNVFAVRPHINKHSSRLGSAGLLVDTTDTDEDGNLDNNNNDFWYGASLANPHVSTGLSTVPRRNPSTIDAAESWVFWLFETTNNPAYPLGAVYDASQPVGSRWTLDPQWSSVWDPNRFMEFDLKRLIDRDKDGWFEYLPPSADIELLPPYVYFDSRTYGYMNQTYAPGNRPIATEFIRQRSIYPSWNPTVGGQRAFQYGTLYPPEHDPTNHIGYAQPYADVTGFYNARKYQLITSGGDDHYSLDYKGSAASDVDRKIEFAPYEWNVFPAPNYVKIVPTETNVTREDRDNIANFTDGRIDTQYED